MVDAGRIVGSPTLNWLVDVENDLRELEVNVWRHKTIEKDEHL
jgi:hypothetical protein